ncbi:MAG: epoxyqueuosine reductase QueH, partial [Treponema sp.]|nr:epoxyqueuosine reductase QueH [Treponema sp.]
TLTVSPHKNALLINEIGSQISETDENKQVCWLPSDFKKKNGFKRSLELSAEYDLYRQDYCGCIYSRHQPHQQ